MIRPGSFLRVRSVTAACGPTRSIGWPVAHARRWPIASRPPLRHRRPADSQPDAPAEFAPLRRFHTATDVAVIPPSDFGEPTERPVSRRPFSAIRRCNSRRAKARVAGKISRERSSHVRKICRCVALRPARSALAARSAWAQSYGVELNNTLTPASGGMAGTSIAAPQDMLSGHQCQRGRPSRNITARNSPSEAHWAGYTFDLIRPATLPRLAHPLSRRFRPSRKRRGAVRISASSQEMNAFGLPVTLGLGSRLASGRFRHQLSPAAAEQRYVNLSLIVWILPPDWCQLTDRLSVGSTLFIGSTVILTARLSATRR